MSHSLLAPSAASRWTTCTASVQYLIDNDDRLDKEERDYTTEGSEAHDWAAKVLQKDVAIEEVPEKFREHISGYVNYALSLVGMKKFVGGDYGVEAPIDLFYREEDTGTIDFVGHVDKTLHILDLKYGQGVDVAAVSNKQLAIYARSYAEKMPPGSVQRVVMHIYQPRTTGPDVKKWDVSLAVLIDFTDPIMEVACMIEAQVEGLRFAPSEEACRFCPAKGFCEARANEVLSLFPEMPDPEDLSLPSPEGMTDEQLALFTHRKKEFARWLKDVEDYVSNRVLGGHHIPGLKVVEGRQGNRKWGNEEDVVKLLQPKLKAANIWQKTLISPTTAEKLLKNVPNLSKKFHSRYESLITRAPGQPVVVPESDKRPALPPPEEQFPKLSAEDMLS